MTGSGWKCVPRKTYVGHVSNVPFMASNSVNASVACRARGVSAGMPENRGILRQMSWFTVWSMLCLLDGGGHIG